MGGGLIILLLAFIISFREGFYIKCKSGERLMGGACKSPKNFAHQPKVSAGVATGQGYTIRGA